MPNRQLLVAEEMSALPLLNIHDRAVNPRVVLPPFAVGVGASRTLSGPEASALRPRI
jgi:hypothetical protein